MQTPGIYFKDGSLNLVQIMLWYNEKFKLLEDNLSALQRVTFYYALVECFDGSETISDTFLRAANYRIDHKINKFLSEVIEVFGKIGSKDMRLSAELLEYHQHQHTNFHVTHYKLLGTSHQIKVLQDLDKKLHVSMMLCFSCPISRNEHDLFQSILTAAYSRIMELYCMANLSISLSSYGLKEIKWTRLDPALVVDFRTLFKLRGGEIKQEDKAGIEVHMLTGIREILVIMFTWYEQNILKMEKSTSDIGKMFDAVNHEMDLVAKAPLKKDLKELQYQFTQFFKKHKLKAITQHMYFGPLPESNLVTYRN